MAKGKGISKIVVTYLIVTGVIGVALILTVALLFKGKTGGIFGKTEELQSSTDDWYESGDWNVPNEDENIIPSGLPNDVIFMDGQYWQEQPNGEWIPYNNFCG